MNKKEFYEERRKWRMIARSSFPDKSIRNKNDAAIVRDFLWDNIWKQAPKWFWDTRPIQFKFVKKLRDSKVACALNLENAPNSYPHKTRNP